MLCLPHGCEDIIDLHPRQALLDLGDASAANDSLRRVHAMRPSSERTSIGTVGNSVTCARIETQTNAIHSCGDVLIKSIA